MEEDELKETWMAHAFTAKMRRAFEKDNKAAWAKLGAACRASSDPAVREAHTAWVETGKIAVVLGGEATNG